MTVHNIKAHPEQFRAVWLGAKTHEVRVNDRGYQTNDELHLHEYDPDSDLKYTGRWVRARVTHLTPQGTWGLPPDICVMSIQVLDKGADWDADR